MDVIRYYLGSGIRTLIILNMAGVFWIHLLVDVMLARGLVHTCSWAIAIELSDDTLDPIWIGELQ